MERKNCHQKIGLFTAADTHTAHITQFYMYKHTTSRLGCKAYLIIIHVFLILEKKTKAANVCLVSYKQ